MTADPHFEVETTDEVYATRDDVTLLARVHRPVAATDVPVLVDAHGGAWRYFDRTADDYQGRGLAARGVAVIAVDFRQGPAHRWPAPVEDLLDAMAWVTSEAERLGVDPARMGMMGGSSGGHLALWATLSALELEPPAPRPRLVVGLWPIADPLARYAYLEGQLDTPRTEPLFDPVRLRRAQERFFGDTDTMAAAAVPDRLTRRAPHGLPPLWLAHPEHDQNVTRSMSQAMVDAWARAGGTAELEDFPGVGHGFVNFGGPDADRCLDRIATVVARHLGPVPATTATGS